EAIASLARPVEFEVKYVGAEPLSLEEQEQVAIFQQQVIALQRELAAVQGLASDISMRLDAIKSVLDQAPNASLESRDTVRKLQSSHRQTLRNLQGDTVLRERNENTPVSIAERVRYAAGATRTIIQKPTGTEKEQFTLAKNELTKIAAELKSRLLKDVKELENYLDKLGAPWTPGRVK
ncbi:MAG TPA: hypothetical protein PKA06_09035, partial [Gemmatales bacterium]|nr:hypothetical protein [Gemmatales bacterium]